MEKKIAIAIIGAGASGMTAAIAAARNGAEVTLFEKNDRVGKKILSTGNGKCNLTNLEFDLEQYFCEDKVKLQKQFDSFSVWETISFFESLGLMVKSKNGYIYPYSEQASSVLDILRMELKQCRVKVVTDTEITEAVCLERSGKFQIKDKEGKTYCFNRLILSCGSPASLKKGDGTVGYEIAKGFGHRIRPVVPGLVQLKSNERFLKALAGVRCHADVKLMLDGKETVCESGELQFTEYGISGIPVFQLSRIAAYALKKKQLVTVHINFFPEQDEKIFFYTNRLRYESQLEKTLEEFLTGTQNKKINMVMIKQAGFRPEMKVKDTGWKKIWTMMQKYQCFVIPISDINTMEKAQVCAGGVDYTQLSVSLQSKLVKGLYFAGEMLDVDGKCGGYNLQWAWTSGYIAGRNAAKMDKREIKDAEN